MKKLLLSALCALAAVQAQATIIQFDLKGTAGFGLLFGNEPAVASGGTGGEIGAGITFDDVTLLLTVSNIGWGSSQGFTDLSSAANNSHIHGPTAAANGSGFTQTSGTIFATLTRSSSAVTGGTFTNAPILFNATQAAQLMNGQFYVNIHTTNNGGGELRGFIVPAVPEPTTMSLLGLGALAFAARRRR